MMRTVLLLSSILVITACGKEVTITQEQVVGTWITSTDSFIDDGIGYREVLLDHFREDGTFTTHTSSEMYWSKTGVPFANIEGPDKGRWSIEDNKVVKHYDESNVTHFTSSEDSVTRAQFEAAFQKKLQSPEVLTVVQVDPEVLVVEDATIGETFNMIRHSPDK